MTRHGSKEVNSNTTKTNSTLQHEYRKNVRKVDTVNKPKAHLIQNTLTIDNTLQFKTEQKIK